MTRTNNSSSGALVIRDVVDSTASDPHLGGRIEIEADAGRLRVRFEGEQEWKSLEWYEVLIVAGCTPPRYREVLDELREKTVDDTVKELVADAAREQSESYKKGYEDGFNAGSKVIVLKQGFRFEG